MADAQRAAERAARLYSVASALATAATPETVAEAVLNEGVAAPGASGGGILLAADTDKLSLPGAVGYDESVLARLREESPRAELPAAVALRTGEAVWLESRDELGQRFPDLLGIEATTAALCAVPLQVEGRRLGAVRFSFREARLFDQDERWFVQALAAQAAQALDRAQLQRARGDVSRRLQRSLLPPRVPDILGLDVAAIYQPFGDGRDVGGDFYDIWPIGEGRWAFAIGDAAGTGPEAAALTALIRHTLRALTLSGPTPNGSCAPSTPPCSTPPRPTKASGSAPPSSGSSRPAGPSMSGWRAAATRRPSSAAPTGKRRPSPSAAPCSACSRTSRWRAPGSSSSRATCLC